MKGGRFFIAACVAGALAPLLPGGRSEGRVSEADFAGWPAVWEGAALEALELSPRERLFADSLAGTVGRFTDGQRQYIIRWIVRPTRRLHPAADCFRASGYRIRPLPIEVDGAGHSWGAFEAVRGDERLRVRERVYDESGRSFCDVSAWYWAASFGRTQGPWWAVTVVGRE